MDENKPHPHKPEENSHHSLLSQPGKNADDIEQKNSGHLETDQPLSPQYHQEWPETISSYHEPTSSTFSTWFLPIILFVLTIFTTLWAGALHLNTRPVSGAWDFLINYPSSLARGLPFAGTLLGILVTHELGHYVLSRIHRVPASLPLFIPGPPHFIGTFGAVIRMKSPIMRKRALFDIGVAGPITGFIAAVFALVVGLSLSEVVPRYQTFGLQLGEPLFLQFIAWIIFGPIPETHDIVLHPIGFAAWFGFFVTALNLIPIGQLDGGHVAFAVFGQRQRTLALIAVPILVFLGLIGWPGWILWACLAGLVGLSHPPVVDPRMPLGKKRLWVAWFALVIFVLSFSPIPFYF